MAARVIATMRMVVRAEAKIRFMGAAEIDRRIAQWRGNQNVPCAGGRTD